MKRLSASGAHIKTIQMRPFIYLVLCSVLALALPISQSENEAVSIILVFGSIFCPFKRLMLLQFQQLNLEFASPIADIALAEGGNPTVCIFSEEKMQNL
jgi:hypothetical protein